MAFGMFDSLPGVSVVVYTGGIVFIPKEILSSSKSFPATKKDMIDSSLAQV